MSENIKPSKQFFSKAMFAVKHSIFTEMMVLVSFLVFFLILLLGLSLYERLYDEAKLESLKTMQSLLNAKSHNIHRYMDEHIQRTEQLALLPSVGKAISAFSSAFKKDGVDSKIYAQNNDKYGGFLEKYLEHWGYYDLFLINTQGDIVYTIQHESDYTTNLNTGAYKDTGLAQVYHDSMRLLQSNTSYFEYYAPSDEAGGFVGTPVISDGKLLGVLALQFDTDAFYHELNDYTGLGQSGEIVVGQLMGDHILITAPLRHDPEAAFKRKVAMNAKNALPIRESSQGKSGMGQIIDWRGNEVLAAWQYIPDLNWGMVVKMDSQEVFSFWPKLQKRLLGIIILGLLACYALLYMFMNHLIAPLRKLTEIAVAFPEASNVSFEGLTVYRNEVGLLADAFYKMIQNIQHSQAELQTSLALLADNNRLLDQRVNQKTEHIRAILDSTVDGILTLNQHGDIVSVNPAALNMFANKEAEMLGQNILPMFEQESQAVYADLFKQAVDGVFTNHPIDMQALTKDGRSFSVEVSLNNMKYGNDNMFLLTIRDITNRKRLEFERLRLSMVVEQASDAIVLTDTHGVFEYVNPAYEALSGYSSEELLGQNIKMVKSGKMSQDFYKKMWSHILSGRVWQSEFTNKNKRGELYVVEQSITPIINQNNDIIGFASVQRDVSNEKKEREKLEHTQRLESLGVLAGGIAHDFNNLLTAILGNAALARNRLEHTSPLHTMLDNIEKSSERAAALCKQMLAYSGKGKFIVEPINLTELIEEMVNLLEVSIQKNVVMRLELSQQLLPIEGDVAQMQQVIMNMVINASEAIENKSGIITIYTGVVDVDKNYLETTYLNNDVQPGRYVTMEISDTGCGMDADTMSHIFDPFFTTKFTGRGLGMSAILGIIRGHHGAIKVYSEKGKGTSFKILLPCLDVVQASVSEVNDPKILEQKGSGTILIVDDEETIRATASMMLEEIGFDVLTAKDGLEGVEVFEKHQGEIRAVLLDMTMPKMNGEEVFRKIRGIQPDVKVILSSGYNQQDATNRFAGKGLAGFIQKPYMPSKLQKILLDILS